MLAIHLSHRPYLLISEISCSSYTELPAQFYQEINPTPILNPSLIKWNSSLATDLKLEGLPREQTVALYAGNWVPSHLKSLALAYAGDQFGHYVPLLGDGRAVLLGESYSQDKKKWDIQLKGSGRTAFSRGGDGRAPLSAVLREYLMSEAMHGLGIPTTRSLAVIRGDDDIYRQEGSVPLGVLTRIAAGYLRVGSFQYAASLGDVQQLKQLTDYAIHRHYPQLLNHPSPYLAFFQCVLDGQARLIADWMGVGFIHGVMNTDNMAISGETIDYGPCAFMDEFDEHAVFSSIDQFGRYAFNHQAHSAHWNLARLASALSALFEQKQALQDALNSFPERFNHYWTIKMRNKIGLLNTSEATSTLIERFFHLLQQHKPDMTNAFRQLCYATDSTDHQTTLLHMLGNQTDAQQWISDWLSNITQQDIDLRSLKINMQQVNPVYIPRNHLVEQAIRNGVEHNDYSLFDTLLTVCSSPYQEQKNTPDLQRTPLAHERVVQTFCGT